LNKIQKNNYFNSGEIPRHTPCPSGIKKQLSFLALLMNLSCLILLVSKPLSAQIVINELQSSNGITLADEDGDYPDWIELYNSGSEAADLQGYALSDSYENPFRWVFPSVILEPNSFLLVLASGKNRAEGVSPPCTLIEFESIWKYLDNGSDQGTAWNSPDFDDSAWPEGPAMFGYGRPLEHDYGTMLSYGPNASDKYPATYFRKTFLVEDVSDLGKIRLTLQVDDGAVIYLNGTEIVRHNMPAGTIDYKTLSNVIVHVLDSCSYDISKTYLNQGENTLAVQVHQSSAGSSDLAFDLYLGSTGSELHTNFSLKSDGEPLLLFDSNGFMQDEVAPVQLIRDISYGRQPDGSEGWYFFHAPTPGEPNHSQPYNGILEPPVFSHLPGFYNEVFDLSITHPDPEVNIYYTLNGNEPSETSLLYQNPLQIQNADQNPDKYSLINTGWRWMPPQEKVKKATVLRAKAVKPGYFSTELTGTFFVNDNGVDNLTLPVFSLITDSLNLFGADQGIYYNNNWNNSWERPASLEFFETNGSCVLSQNAGIRIHGGWTRELPMKSLRLYARSRYGEDTFMYGFFPDQPYQGYQRLILRNSGNDWQISMFRDAALQATVSHLNLDTQAYRPSILYINGEYWGIHNIRERFDKYYLNRVYGVNTEQIDHLELWGRVKEGNNNHYYETLDYIEHNGLQSRENYTYIQTRIDVENFTDFQIVNIFYRNIDWPGNNVDFWRLQTQYDPYAPYGHDGRWRWFLFDMDWGIDLAFSESGGNTIAQETYLHNTLEFAAMENGPDWPNPDWSTFLFREFLQNDSFKIYFINRFADLLNTAFLPERVTGIFTDLKKNIEDEMPSHISRWNKPENMDIWNNYFDNTLIFISERPYWQREHLSGFFELEGQYKITLDVSDDKMGFIRMNTVNICSDDPGIQKSPYPWEGIYFKGIPVELEAVPAPGYAFSHWEGLESDKACISNRVHYENISYKAHFKPGLSSQLIHFWIFDTSLPNDTPLENIDAGGGTGSGAYIAFHSALAGYPFTPAHSSWRKASMERRNAPTELNYRPEGNEGKAYGDAAMRGVQIKQPFTGDGGENTLIFHLPTTDYEKVVFTFAAKDEGAADSLFLDYSVNPNDTFWQTDGITQAFKLRNTYQLFTADFTDIPESGDNPCFRIRLRFRGSDMSADEGNRVTFNNISLDGFPTEAVSLNPGTVIPERYILGQNYPNPFNPATRIQYGLPEQSHVNLMIYDISGRLIKNWRFENQSSGWHDIIWNGTNSSGQQVSTGVYIYQLQAGDFVETKKMVFMK